MLDQSEHYMIKVTISNYEVIISPITYTKHLNWADAVLYCNFVEIDGLNDWYMPSRAELNVLCLNNDFFQHHHGIYWSQSEEYRSYPDDYNMAWVQSFPDGYQRLSYKDSDYWVRPIRKLIL